jgi:Zn-finger nucleic acid-binding protein
MKCPICEVDLMMTDRQGVEIDYCPKCRGVWLDRGELDKIVEKSSVSQLPMQNDSERMHSSGYCDSRKNDNHYSDSNHYYKKHKKKGFLGDLFDF